VSGKRQESKGLGGTFHDLFAADAYLAWLVSSQRLAGVWVDDLELRVPDDGAAGAGLHLERLLGEGQAHGQHGPCLGHPIPLVETNRDFMFSFQSIQHRTSPLPNQLISHLHFNKQNLSFCTTKCDSVHLLVHRHPEFGRGKTGRVVERNAFLSETATEIMGLACAPDLSPH